MAALAVLSVCSTALQTVALFLFIHDPSHVIRCVLLPYPFRLGTYGLVIWHATRLGYLRWGEFHLRRQGCRALLQSALPIGFSSATILLYYNSESVVLAMSANIRLAEVSESR
jgi:hypothetical protein